MDLLQMIQTSAVKQRTKLDPLSPHQSIRMHRKVRKCKCFLVSLVILLSSGLLCRADLSHLPSVRSNQNSNEINNRLTEDPLISKLPKSQSGNEQNSPNQTPNSYYFEVKENTIADQLVGIVHLPVGPLYRFGNGQSVPEFHLDSATGRITTTKHPLDRERQQFYNLIILSSLPTTANPIQVKIRVLDCNDNIPFWLNDSPIRQISFSETAPVGSKVLLDSAVDLDEDELRYELLYCSPLEQCSCEQRRSASVVNLVNDDVNSHVNSDSDTSVNNNNNNKNQSRPFRLNFNQKSSILNLELAERLDRALHSNYICKLCVFDLHNQWNALNLNITVFMHHAAHSPPLFKQSNYSVTVNHYLKKGDLILTVQAHPNESNAPELTHRLQDGEADFHIEPTTGSIYAAHDGPPTCTQSDASQPRACTLTVLCENADRQQAKAQVTVYLSSTDNLHVPEIKILYFNHRFVQYAIVDQAANFGTAVAAISVFDADSGQSGQTQLQIVSGNELEHFYLDSEFSSAGSYVIRVNQNFTTTNSSKKPNAYNLTLKATDNDRPPLSSTQNLIIKINEMAGEHKLPVFKQALYKAELVETAPVGSFVCLVNAIDHDQQSIVYFYSLSGNNSDYFYVDSQTGMVTLAKQLDRELANEIELKVFVRDTQLDSEWSSAKLRIKIGRVNLHRPTVARRASFKPNYEIEEGEHSTLLRIAEGNRVNYEFELADEDLGENGSVAVELLYDYQGLFLLNIANSINKRVVHLQSTKELDYESGRAYELPLFLSDQGTPKLSSQHTVRIEVIDLDDQPAYVYPSHYFIDLNKSDRTSSVLRIRTIDSDKSSPTKYFFNFNHNHKNLNFVNSLASIDEHTGSVTLKKSINLDAFPSYLPFNVACDSCDRSGQQATIHVYIKKSEVTAFGGEQQPNQQANQQLNQQLNQQPSEQLTISELTEPKSVLLNITNIEMFAGLKLTDYRLAIADGDPEQSFGLSGRQLVLAKRLDYEKIREYRLTICAYNDEHFRSVNLIIRLRNENSHHPQFDRPFVYLEVPRSTPYHLTVYRLNAIDPDESDEIVNEIVTGESTHSNTVYHFATSQSPHNSSLIQNGNYMFRINRNQLELNVNLNERRILSGGQLAYAYTGDCVYSVSIQAKDLRLKNDPLTSGHQPNNHQANSRRMINIFIKISQPALQAAELFARSLEVPKSFYELNIEESRQINSKLLQFDLLYNRQLDGLLTFAIVNGDPNQQFGIFPDGTLFLKNKLDREQNEKFLLQVAIGLRSPNSSAVGQQANHAPQSNQQSNQTTDQLNKRISVLITVIDTNNKPPKFEKELYQFYVSESSPVNSSIGIVHATDPDLDLNSLVNYHLLPAKHTNYIGLNSITGQLYLKSSVDYETLKQISLEVEAEDQSLYERRLKAKCKVQIQILDVNDVPPCFEIFDAETNAYACSDKLKQQISIMENLKPNTTIHEFKARDPDTGVDQLRFTLIESEFSSSFDLNERTGRLRLVKNLDREINERIELLVKLDDGRHQAFNRFTVVLEDANDSTPVWSPMHTSATLFVSESTEPATSLLTLNATDLDSGLNGQVHFEIVSVESVRSPNAELCKQQPRPFCEQEECFRIEGNQLLLANYLDYENEQQYAISLAAVDYFGLRSELLTVKLRVGNELDSSPKFKKTTEQANEETISIFENVQLNTVILSLDAFDCDGADDQLTYELVKCQILGTYHKRCPLELDARTGKLTSIDQLDYEEIKRINLKIKVSDLAGNSDLKELSIAIMNLNDNLPRIPLSTSFVVIKQRQQPVEKNEILAQLQATDLDRERVLYRIASDSAADSQVEASVYVDENDGFVYAKRRIEHNTELKFNVMLIDEGGLFTSELINLMVLFTNASLDTQDLVFEVYENEPVGLLIHQFKCATQTCRYHLNTCNKLFNIDESGELRTESSLDRELKAAYYFDVFMVDASSAIQVFKIKVNVADRNDCVPKLIGNSIERLVRVKENERPKSVLFDLATIVTDFDLATQFQFGQLNCSVVSLNRTAKKVLSVYDNPFLIESNTGKIILNRELDREMEEKYELWFSISDGLFKVNDRLTVVVADINDSTPSFDRKFYSFSVPENTKNRTVIGKVEAKDPDLNSVIRYKIVSEQDDSPFRINEKSGAISIVRPVDYEKDNHLFISVCQATDGEFVSAPVTLYFNILNLNDCGPLFERADYKFIFNDSQTVGEQLFCLSAADADNDQLIYRMDDGDEKEYQLFTPLVEEFYFEVNSENGCVHLLKPFNVAEKDLFQFTMSVTDGQHQDFAAVQVHVLSSGRQPATYRKSLSIKISETAKAGETIYRFNENVQLLNTSFVPFKISPFNELVLIAKLSSNQYAFRVNYNQSTQNVTVNVVQSEHRRDPVLFANPLNKVHVHEDHKLATPLIELDLINFKSGDKLELVSGNRDDQFMIHKNQLLLRKPLDYEKAQEYSLTVRAAKDRAGDETTNDSTASIEVYVQNVLERPVFLDTPYLFRWCENTVGEVGRFIAKSEYDLQSNSGVNNLKYILKSNEFDQFHLDTNSGVLSVRKEIDREALKSPLIELKVLVIDELNADLQNEVLASISIENLNDEPPKCSKANNKIDLTENVAYAAGYAFANVTAVDRDNDVLVYRLNACELTANLIRNLTALPFNFSTSQCSKIALNERTGEIYATEAITFDRELEEEYRLMVSASDGEFSTVCVLQLTIQDANDASPKLSARQSESRLVQKELAKEDHLRLTIPYQYFTSDLTESEHLFLVGLNADDLDQWNTPNSQISFRVQNHQPASGDLSRRLKLNRDNGVLTIQNSLVENEKPQQNRSVWLDVLLQDGNPKNSLESKVRVDLTLYDLRSTALKWTTIFEPLLSELQVSESTPVATTIHEFRLVDPRLQNSTGRTISLVIVGGDYDGRFQIARDERSNFKLVLQRELDFEYVPSYQIYLEATLQDDSQPANQPVDPQTINQQKMNFQILELNIKLINEDDHAPQFSRPVYNVSILEEQKPGLFVIQLDATDPDGQEPTAKSPNTVTNLEDEFGGDSDFGVDKSNANSNEQQFRFELLSSDVPFRIDQYSGAVFTTERIDREETGDLFELTVQVVDHGGLKSQAQLNVFIEDLNDQMPRFTSLFRVNVSESEEIGAFIVKITYTDRDRSANGSHKFSIDDSRFTIDSAGNVYLAARLDCDSGEDEINMKVTLNDGEWNQDTTLTVHIQDENDEFPKFQFCGSQFGKQTENECIYHFVLGNDQNDRPLVGNVSAVDLDKGLNSLVSYEFTEQSALFRVDPQTGEIFSDFSKLQPPPLSTLMVKACDNGMLPKCAVAKVYLIRNEAGRWISLPIPLDLSNQTVVYRDTNNNHRLIDSDGFGYCNDATALTIFAYQNQSLVFNGEHRVKLGQQFQCHFWSMFELQKFTSLKITITKRNLVEPQFVAATRSQLMLNETNRVQTNEIEGGKKIAKQVYQFKTTENGFNSELTFSLSLLSVQFHPNALAYYSKRFRSSMADQRFFAKSIEWLLLSNNLTAGYLQPFSVDARTGAMYLVNALDYRLITSYKYEVTVADGALFSPKSSKQTLDVHIQSTQAKDQSNDDKATLPISSTHRLPTNQTKPKFTKKQYEFDLLEQTDLNSIISNLNHTVVDGAQQSFEFQLLKPIEFGIDLDANNNLIVSDSVDFESFSMNEIYKQTQMDNVSISAIKLKFGLLVKVSGGLVESSADYDRAELLINLIDLNEPPRFERPSLDCLLVRTNGPCAYQFVNECTAKALDLDANDYLRYRLLNHNHLFAIDEHKGTISLTGCNLSSLFLPSEQSLDVVAIDSSELQSKLKINIKLNWRSRVDTYQSIEHRGPADGGAAVLLDSGRPFHDINNLFYANASTIDKDLIGRWCVKGRQVPESTERMTCYRQTVDRYCCECKSNSKHAFRGANDCGGEDLCSSSSADYCKNGGLCKQTSARERVCLCRRAFRGARCEQALTACNEKAGKCGVNGVCQITKSFGHRCNCNDEHTFGVECNAFSLGIRPHAYIRLNTSLHEVNDELSMTFASYYRMNYGHRTGSISSGVISGNTISGGTISGNTINSANQPKEEDHGQLMLYNQGQPNMQTGRTDFIAVELYEKYLLLRIGGSHQSKFVELKVHANKHDLLDGRYYKFTLIRNRKIAHISIYSCERMYLDNQLNCNSLLNQSSISYNQASFRFDSNPLFVGGLDIAHGGNGKLFAQKTKGQVQARSNFVGCLYKAIYNGEKFNEYIAEKSFVDPICRPSLIGSEQSIGRDSQRGSQRDSQRDAQSNGIESNVEPNVEPISQTTQSSTVSPSSQELTTNCGKEALYSKHNWFENKCGCTIAVQPANNLTGLVNHPNNLNNNLQGLHTISNIVYESSMPCSNLCEVQLNKKSLIRLKLTEKWNAIMKSETYQTKLEEFTIRFFLTSFASENMLSNLWTNGYLSIRLSSNGTIFMINEEDQLEQVIKLNGKFKLNQWNTYVIRSSGEQFVNDQPNRFSTALFKNNLKTMIVGGDLTGCVSHLIVNGHLVLSGKEDQLYELQTENVNGFGCKGIFESSPLSLDAISIGVILVIMFFAILLLVVSTSYMLFNNSSKRKTTVQPRSTLPPISKHHHFHNNKTLTPHHSMSQMLGNSYSSQTGYYEEPLYYGSDYFQHNEKLNSANFTNQFNLSSRSQF